MSQYGSWSVKGVDDRARAIAKEKARLKGITLGDYINNLLLDGHSEAGPRDMGRYQESPLTSAFSEPSRPHALDGLAQRIEAVEARSTLAITGIDQSVLGLLARLESSENSTSAMTAEVERMVDELRETHEMLHDKVGALEADESGRRSLEAMKALEDALGKLATHVYEEGRLNQDDSMAMKGRVEAGFGELNDRVEGVEIKVESTLAEAAQRVEKAVEQAELRAEGTSRHLSERVSNIESSVATKLANVDDVTARMKTVEGDVSGAISSMEGTLLRVQERLNRAEQTTDTALQALEGTFASLDQRINRVAEDANPEKANALRHELEQRFDALAKDLRVSVDESRRHLADEIERAASGNNPELMGALETRVNALESTDIGARLDGVDGQLSHLSETLVRHVEESENRSASAIEKVGEQVVGLSETMNQRIADSERRSAGAIEQVGEQVATAIKHVQARQEQSQRQLAEQVAGSESRQEARLSDALSNISERLTDMQSQTATAVSPVQRAIVSLASRLEALEDFNAPPLAEPAAAALPDMPAMEVDRSPIEIDPAPTPEPEPVLEAAPEPDPDPIETEHFADSIAALESEAAEADAEQTDFIAGLPDFDDQPGDAHSAEPDTISLDDAWAEPDAAPETDHDYAPEAADNADQSDVFFDEESPNTDDPLAELGSWDESQEEARDSDIFSSEETSEEAIDLLPTFDDVDLAHNTEDLVAEDTEHLDEFDPNDDAPDDYLTRARDAAIAAASDSKAEAKSRRGRRSAASVTVKPSSPSKFPIIAAASVFALTAAGAGAWVALRGKIPFTESNAPAVETKTTLAEAGIEAPTEPSLVGVEFEQPASETLDETLFEDEGSVAGVIEAQPAEAPPIAEIAAPVVLPIIPASMTIEQAVSNGNPVAQFQLGLERLEAQDFAAAADLISQAAEKGLPAAQYRMAKLHERGIGVPRDFAEARAWTERAANGGNIKAMHDLAVFYADGEGGAQSYAAAAEWSKKAADFGVVDSQYNLALLYENGLGISPSQTEALYWYEIAAANGDASAPGNVATLRDALPLDQAQQAQRRASTWVKATPNAAANGNFGPQDWTQASRAQVKAVQEVLNGLGYDAGPADGLAGAGTRTAIRAFQADNGLPTSGTIEANLIETLNAQSQAFAG